MRLHTTVLKVTLLACALALGACRCGNDVNMVETRFRVAPETQSLDFGRALEGTVVTRTVTLIAETRASVSVGASTKSPFSTEPLVEIPGGSQVDHEVTFRAGNGESNGELVLTSGRQELRVGLRGVGVREPLCTPSASCRESKYSLELDRCVETVVPDETQCNPDSACLEQGRCRAGQCLGVARRCNDNDACTSDACAADAGCVNTRITCPQPTTLCRVPTCDARTGCGEAEAPDGTPCGNSNCVNSRICLMGACVDFATPEGTECGPAVACYGVSRCQNQRCARPDAGQWLPTWSARVVGTPLAEPPALLNFGSSLYFSVCGLPRLPIDGGFDDAGLRDAGGPDADGGRDAGSTDAGPDTECAVLSYTSTGFDRFITRVPGPERLTHVGPAGVVLRVDGGLVFRSRSMGTFLGGWETGTLAASQVAMMRDGGVVVALRGDGGTSLVVTSTVAATPLAYVEGAVSHLAIGLDDAVFALARGQTVYRFGTEADGGPSRGDVVLDAGAASLAVADEVVVAGARLTQFSLGSFQSPRVLEGPSDAGLLEREVIITPSTVFRFFRGCRVLAMSCLPVDAVTWVRAFSRSTGVLLWEDTLLPAGASGRLIEATALRIPGGIESALAAIVEGDVDGGVINGLVVTLDGGRALECPFPDGTGMLTAAVFTAGQLVTLSTRPDGGVTLEGWTLGALPLESSGWTSAEGSSGQRRPAP
jgi:hypothetical protein